MAAACGAPSRSRFWSGVEVILSERLRIEARLGDWFDLVGGTSTGALIAGALALGFRTEQVKEFYLRLAPRAFSRPAGAFRCFRRSSMPTGCGPKY